MTNGWRAEFPESVAVPFEEFRGVVVSLEALLEQLIDHGDAVAASALDDVIGRITRWLWRQLDSDGGYDGVDG